MEFARLAAGFVLIYVVLERVGAWTNSLYGEYGALICGSVIVAALVVERWLFATLPGRALGALGFGRWSGRGLLAALLASLALLAYLPIYVLVTGQPLTLRDGGANKRLIRRLIDGVINNVHPRLHPLITAESCPFHYTMPRLHQRHT
jgi:hypothetical protein